MFVVRKLIAGLAGAAALVASPASAQFYFQGPNLAGQPVTGQEPGIALPNATAAENKAALVWSLRAALNVAALQCDFAPSLLTVNNYNAMIGDHKAELKAAFETIGRYFVRVGKSKAAGQTALDQYGTRIYSEFSTVAGQFTFCQTAHSVGRDAIFAPRGQLVEVAEQRMRELRNSLLPSGEQRFPGFEVRTARFGWLPNPDKRCWKRDEWLAERCGSPYSGAIAAR